MPRPVPVMLESLEDRRLLAGHSAAYFEWLASTTAPATVVTARPARHVAVAAAPAPDLVGSWKGKLSAKVLFFTKSLSASFVITAQTATTITGSVTVQGNTAAGTFAATINPDRTFTFTLERHKVKVTIEGSISAAGDVISGKASIAYHGFSVKGKFKFEKQ